MSQSFECPITLERMADPVIAADGYTYERSAIEEHFRIRGPRSPLSNASLPHTTLVPNRALKDLIEQETSKNVQPTSDKKEETNSENALQRFTSFVTDHLKKLFSSDKNREDYFEGLLQRFSKVIEVEDQLVEADVDVTRQQGIVVNRSEHWFAVRKIGNRWWNLNSTLERPEYIEESSAQ